MLNFKFSAIGSLSLLILAGCAFAPGQHLNTNTKSLFSSRDDGAQIEVLPINARIIALQEASGVDLRIPEPLLSYQPPEYRIGVGDQVKVTVWEHPQLTNPGGAPGADVDNQRLVRDDGTIFYPYAGIVKAAGLTIEELRRELTMRLTRVLSSPQVDVTLARTTSQRISISGAFTNKTPLEIGVVPISLTEALGRAGVDAERSDFSNLTLTRQNQTWRLDLDKLTLMGAPLDRVFLAPGDSLHLPFNDQKKIYLMGELRNPSSLTYRTSSISLADAIGQGGSLLQTSAKASATYVIRHNGRPGDLVSNATVYSLNLNDPVALVMADRFQLKAGDVVYVGAPGIVRWNRFINQLFPSLGIVATANLLAE